MARPEIVFRGVHIGRMCVCIHRIYMCMNMYVRLCRTEICKTKKTRYFSLYSIFGKRIFFSGEHRDINLYERCDEVYGLIAHCFLFEAIFILNN